MSLFAELRRRRVFRVVGLYAVVSWVLIQVTATVFPVLMLPDWSVRLVVALFLLGLPVVVVLAWMFDLTPQGMRRTDEPSESTGATPSQSSTSAAEASPEVPRLRSAGPHDDSRNGQGASAAAQAASVVVLPFSDLSPTRDQEYFSDGVTEEILTALSQIRGLRVPGRTTSFSFKGKSIPVVEIARQLNVAYVLEGSVRRDGERLRITAQLVDALSDTHLWSQTFDREMRDVFAVQEEIATSIVGALKLSLDGMDHGALVRQPTTHLEAYKLYLQGRHHWNQRGPGGLERAIQAMRQAITLDPGFALAYASIAEAYMLLPVYTDVHPNTASPQAMEAATRALDLDPTIAQAHDALAILQYSTADWEAAERSFRRAVELDPGYAPARYHYSYLLQTMGRLDEALAECRRSLELDPLLLTGNLMMGGVLLALRRYREAVGQLQHLTAIAPAYTVGRARLALAHALAGEPDAALSEAVRTLAQEGNRSTIEVAWLGYAFAGAGRADRAEAMLAELERRRSAGEFVSPIAPAYVRAALGEKEEALRLLEQAVRQRLYYAHWLNIIGADPGLDPLRDDPRFRAVCRAVGLEPGTGSRRDGPGEARLNPPMPG